jgi:hypothetical protein
MRKRIAPLLPLLPPLLPPLLLLLLPPPQAAALAPPLLPLIKQWQQWRQHAAEKAAGDKKGKYDANKEDEQRGGG